MAAYAETTTVDQIRAERISQNLGIITGRCDLTNYNTTGAEITDITKWFKVAPRVIVDGLSDNGYAVFWDPTDKCFHAHVHNHTITLSATHAGNAVELSANSNDAALGEAGGAGYTGITGIQDNDADSDSEVSNDVDIGAFNFIAIGII